MQTRRLLALLLAASISLVFSLGSAPAAVKLPPVLSDHMVLQRDMLVPIWGTASPGEQVSVAFRSQTKTATADSQGKWLVKLDPLQAGGPDELTVRGANSVTFKDVLVGEVWVGSGQSNMQMGVGSYVKNDPVLAKNAGETYPRLRLVKNAGRDGWQVATPQTIPGFSAMLFSFGLPLHKELDVPVGLMVGAVGGTPSGFWLSEAAYNADAACKEVVAKYAAAHSPEEEQKRYDREKAQYEKAAAAAKQAGTRGPRPPVPPQKPGECLAKVGNLYEAHIRPFIPYGMRGVLWDQGESGTAICGVDQYTLMGALIRGWRAEWGQGDFPFIYIQKPSGGGSAWDPADPVTCQGQQPSPLPATPPSDGQYRETHIRIAQYPNTAMATASDLGPGTHPTNKSGYGVRAVRVALGMVYGRPVEIYGPVYKSHAIEGGKLRITFTHVGQGLAFRPGPKLQGFAIAGADKKFYWADAAIDGDTIVLTSDKVDQPVAVRYAWAQNHTWANLFNKDGLPGLPFRTDTW